MLRELPFGNDGDFSHRAVVNRINGDLANDFGNLAQRVLSMVQRYCEGRVPEPAERSAADQALLAAAEALHAKLRGEFAEQGFHRALEAVWQVIAEANRYVDEQAPWTLRKTDTVRLGTVLYTLVEVIRRIAILTQPVVPDAAARLLDQLAQPAEARDFAALTARPLEVGTLLPKPEGIFPRYVEAEEVAG
jgi:methionyl-tRNA synthetase